MGIVTAAVARARTKLDEIEASRTPLQDMVPGYSDETGQLWEVNDRLDQIVELLRIQTDLQIALAVSSALIKGEAVEP